MTNKNWYKGYKVIRRKPDGARVSAMVDILGCGAVTYEQGRLTEPAPGCGPLCVFESCVAAEQFWEGSSRQEIWQCEYLPSEHKTIWTPEKSLHLAQLPRGSALADAVRLLRKIK